MNKSLVSELFPGQWELTKDKLLFQRKITFLALHKYKVINYQISVSQLTINMHTEGRTGWPQKRTQVSRKLSSPFYTTASYHFSEGFLQIPEIMEWRKFVSWCVNLVNILD
jgi:hypothetical protein